MTATIDVIINIIIIIIMSDSVTRLLNASTMMIGINTIPGGPFERRGEAAK
ncbi:hypothetical protein [Pelagicoccus albus]|uniref:Uncharacterized protein n=1 Tax=Pelagicoccus albus TaxID=415222 RepID=A0A7X1B5N8_9BACT|nr:hypothetical protein [Pelagicoccus albus]MBC2606085.1 hypothetical protein [Pelagicoccus albus]